MLPLSTNGLKRRQSEAPEEGQEGKRQRISPGKNSPTATRDVANHKHPAQNGGKGQQDQPAAPREARRKSGVADEKQRNKRLFGALLGNLNQPGDRTSKRRQEIESRRKAELQRQDDERIEDKQRRLEKLAERRGRAQVDVDEQNVGALGEAVCRDRVCTDMHWQMRIRHSSMLNTANFLLTTSEPRLVT